MKSKHDAERRRADTFTIDGAYLREQTREALKLFFAPLAGVYNAVHERPAAEREKRT